MRGSAEDRWHSTGFIGGYDEMSEAAAAEDATDRLTERVGSPEAVEFGANMVRLGKIGKLKGLVDFG